ELVLVAIAIATIIGIPAGIYAGYRPKSFASKAIMALSILGFSVPTFWIGMLLIMGFAVELGWLPSGGRGDEGTFLGISTSLATANGWSHVIMPAVNLSLFKMGLMIRLTRAGMVEAMQTDYVKFARAQGLPDRQIVFKHVLRNISIPVVTVFGLELGSTLAFAVVTESVFNWPGVGKLIIDSILTLDRPVMVTYLILVVILFVIINFTVDIVYARLDPRVRLGGTK
ncbi:MAG: ABC transporter permease, partial [Paracoccaceae bacterium]